MTQCDHCGHEEISYNSCRNRHCPKCQGSTQAAWLAARERELLEVPYCHVVFTLPGQLSALALDNPRPVYTLLLQAVAETLHTIARDPKHLGAEIGFLGVLHTWGQQPSIIIRMCIAWSQRGAWRWMAIAASPTASHPSPNGRRRADPFAAV